MWHMINSDDSNPKLRLRIMGFLRIQENTIQEVFTGLNHNQESGANLSDMTYQVDEPMDMDCTISLSDEAKSTISSDEEQLIAEGETVPPTATETNSLRRMKRSLFQTAQRLKKRMEYAHLKIKHGWANMSLEEIKKTLSEREVEILLEWKRLHEDIALTNNNANQMSIDLMSLMNENASSAVDVNGSTLGLSFGTEGDQGILPEYSSQSHQAPLDRPELNIDQLKSVLSTLDNNSIGLLRNFSQQAQPLELTRSFTTPAFGSQFSSPGTAINSTTASQEQQSQNHMPNVTLGGLAGCIEAPIHPKDNHTSCIQTPYGTCPAPVNLTRTTSLPNLFGPSANFMSQTFSHTTQVGLQGEHYHQQPAVGYGYFEDPILGDPRFFMKDGMKDITALLSPDFSLDPCQATSASDVTIQSQEQHNQSQPSGHIETYFPISQETQIPFFSGDMTTSSYLHNSFSPSIVPSPLDAPIVQENVANQSQSWFPNGNTHQNNNLFDLLQMNLNQPDFDVTKWLAMAASQGMDLSSLVSGLDLSPPQYPQALPYSHYSEFPHLQDMSMGINMADITGDLQKSSEDEFDQGRTITPLFAEPEFPGEETTQRYSSVYKNPNVNYLVQQSQHPWELSVRSVPVNISLS